MNDTRPRTAVLHQFTGIGDLVWHVQYFKAVAQQSHGGRVSVIAQPSTMARSLIGNAPWVKEVIDHDHRPRRSDRHRAQHAGLAGMWRMGQLLKSHGFERLVMFSGRPSRGLMGAFTGIPERTGYGYHWLQRLFLTHGPYIERYVGSAVAVSKEAAEFAMAHGFCDAPLIPRLDIPDGEMVAMAQRLAGLPKLRIALAIGTSEPHKQWGALNYSALASELLDLGCGVAIIGGRTEQAMAQQIMDSVHDTHRAAIMAITDASVLGSAAAIRHCTACVGNDTGMVHVAAAVERPVIVLLGPRPALDHDTLISSLTGPTIPAIPVTNVMRALADIGIGNVPRHQG